MDNFTLTGTVLVHNICFEKMVKVRYSQDYWLTHQDVTAEYRTSVAGDIDKFSFSFTLHHTLPPGARVELCVCADLGGQEFWDSNSGLNYQIECLLMPPKTSALVPDLLGAGIEMRRRVPHESSSAADIYY